MYRNCYYDGRTSSVFLRTWDENGKRIDASIPFKPYLYIEREGGDDGVSIFKTPLEKRVFKNSYERKNFVEANTDKYRIFYNLPVDQQYLIDTYYDKIDDKDFSKFDLKIANIDIETKCNKYSDLHLVEIKNTDGEVTKVYVDELSKLDKNKYTIFDEESKQWERIANSCYQKTEFPQPDTALFPILLITLHDSLTDEYHTWGVKEYKSKAVKRFYHKCDSEVELLTEFVKYWKKDCPDILVGWAIETFDVPYLINRITNILGESSANKLSPVNKLYASDTANTFGQKFKKWHIQGVSILDYLLVYKKFARDKRESYKLNYIGEVELDEGKLEINATNLSTLADTDWENFVDYNIQDVALVNKLENKLKYIQIARLLAYKGCSNFESALGTVGVVTGAICVQSKKSGLVVPTFPSTSVSEFVGGFVREPVTGLSESIVSFDANSLYPNTIITLNISPETKIGKIINNPDFNNPEDIAELVLVNKKVHKIPIIKLKQFLISENICLSKSNILYSQKTKGIIPELIDDVYTKRVNAKKEYTIIGNKIEKTSQDKLDMIYLDIYQQNLKLFMNSLYGALANNYCIFADVDAASSVTTTGRAVGNEAGVIIDRFAKEKYGISSSLALYGDTDSLVGNTKIRHSNGIETIEELWNLNVNNITYSKSGHEMKDTNGIKILTYQYDIPIYDKIKRIIRHKVSKGKYKIVVNNNEVITTEDHGMVVIRDNKLHRVSPKNIIKGDKIIYLESLISFITEDFIVEQLEDFVDEYVYDFEMDSNKEEEHVYFANDILVHNSIYITINPILKKLGYKLLTDDGDITDEASKIVDEIDEVLNKDINTWAKNDLYTTDPRFLFKREVIAESGVFLMKKRYILHVNDNEGKKVDKFKYVGVEVAKSTISKEIKGFIKNIMNTTLISKSAKITNAVYKKAYEDFKDLNIDDIAFRISVNNYSKYSKSVIINTFEKGTPVHVKASISYNLLLKELNIEDKYERINSNQKVKWFYLKKNIYGLDAIAYPSEYPIEFNIFQIDYKRMFEKQLVNAIERLYASVNWMLPDVGNQTTTNLFDLFSNDEE